MRYSLHIDYNNKIAQSKTSAGKVIGTVPFTLQQYRRPTLVTTDNFALWDIACDITTALFHRVFLSRIN